MIELCCEYLFVRCIWLYVIIMSRTNHVSVTVLLARKVNVKYFSDSFRWSSGLIQAFTVISWEFKNFIYFFLFYSEHAEPFPIWIYIALRSTVDLNSIALLSAEKASNRIKNSQSCLFSVPCWWKFTKPSKTGVCLKYLQSNHLNQSPTSYSVILTITQ